MSYYCITVCSQRYDGVEEQNWLGHKVPKMHAPFFRVSQGDESPHSQQPWLLDQSHLQAFWCLQNFLEGTHTPRRDIFSSNALPSHLQAGMRQVSYMTVWSKSGQPGHRSYFFEKTCFSANLSRTKAGSTNSRPAICLSCPRWRCMLHCTCHHLARRFQKTSQVI